MWLQTNFSKYIFELPNLGKKSDLKFYLKWHIDVGNVIPVRMHYGDVIMSAISSQITSLTFVYSTAYSGADKKKHQSSASLTFVRGNHRWSVDFPHKGPETRKMFPFDNVIVWSTIKTIIVLYDITINIATIKSVTSQRAHIDVRLATQKQFCWCYQLLIIHMI